MRLIIEKMDGAIYAYRETETQYKQNKKQRTSPKLALKDLDRDCNLHNQPADCHLVVKYA